MIELICTATGERFLKDRREYDRQIRRGVMRFFKDRRTATLFLADEKTASARVIKECKVCGKPFESSTAKHARLCCSRECSVRCTHQTIDRDPELKEALRLRKAEAARHHHELVRRGERPPQIYRNGKECRPSTQEELTRICSICDKSFLVETRHIKVKTCSKVCRRVLSSRSASANPNCGGETNYRRYRYRDILMDSQWEVDIAQWMDDHGIQWRRDRKMVFRWMDATGKSRRYHPDFYLPDHDLYLDPKNKYLIEKDRFKIETVMKTHGVRIVWGLRDHVIDYLKSLSGS